MRYTITYKLRSGTNSPENPRTYTVEDAFPLAAPVRNGFTFGGWFLDAKHKKPIDAIALGTTKKKTLYAKWTPNFYTVILHSNIPDAEETLSLSCKGGTTKRLPLGKFIYAGHHLVGWNTEKDGSGTHFSGNQSMKSYPAEDGAVIDLYAEWQPYTTAATFRGVPYTVINTKVDPIPFAQVIDGKCCETVDFKKYHGKCLSFAYYHASCMVKGITETSMKKASSYHANGCHFHSKTYATEAKLMKVLYQQLNLGKPTILMVAATDLRSRHFVTVVGYKASVQSGEQLRATDLLIIDSMDGQLEAMDKAIYPEGARVLYRQNKKYQLQILS